jgi:uncharacterized protein (TIGR03067 family)
MNRVATVLAIAVAVTCLATAQEPMSKELAALQGRWIITHVGGQPVGPNDPEGAFMVKGDEYAQGVGGKLVERGRIKLDTTKKPVAVEFIITAGKSAGSTQLGIVEITGDTVRFHVSPPGSKERAKDFTPREGFDLIAAKRRQ